MLSFRAFFLAALYACAVAGCPAPTSADADSGAANAAGGDDGGTVDDLTDAGAHESDEDAGCHGDDCAPTDAGETPHDDGGPALGGDAGESDDDAGIAGDDDAGESDDGGTSVDDDILRFVVIGDTGKGNTGQYAVADAFVTLCDELGGCAFGLMLGDNIYDTGVDDTEDPQWQEKFELPYADVDFPLYATLGNHDYGAPPVLQSFAGGIGIDPRRADAQVEYSAISEKFMLPDTHYRFSQGPVEFTSLNTTSLFWSDFSFIANFVGFTDENDRMTDHLSTWAEEATAPWRLAFGHHPYLSNGRHGNAGVYDNVFISGLIGSGTALKDYFDEHILGQFDVYLAGHDHNLQDLGATEGTELLLSGGGATRTLLEGTNPNHWQASRTGFMMIEATTTTMTFIFVVLPEEGDIDPATGLEATDWFIAHTRTITKN
jgi:tartrate-resistant acid phosphatase type 5